MNVPSSPLLPTRILAVTPHQSLLAASVVDSVFSPILQIKKWPLRREVICMRSHSFRWQRLRFSTPARACTLSPHCTAPTPASSWWGSLLAPNSSSAGQEGTEAKACFSPGPKSTYSERSWDHREGKERRGRRRRGSQGTTYSPRELNHGGHSAGQHNTEMNIARAYHCGGNPFERSVIYPPIPSLIHSFKQQTLPEHLLRVCPGPFTVWKWVRTCCQKQASSQNLFPAPKSSKLKMDFPGSPSSL